MKRKQPEHWAFDVLRRQLKTFGELDSALPDAISNHNSEQSFRRLPEVESGTIFLFDPDTKRDIERTFMLVYADILSVFDQERFSIPPVAEIELHEKRDREASCKAVFIVRDSKRPTLGDGSPWWYLRFNLDIREGAGYSLLTELHLSLPFWLESDWVLDFMIGARDWQNPPTITVDHDEFSLRFECSNRGWLSFADGSSEMEKFLSPFRSHIQIAKAIDRFSETTNNRFLKCNMLQSISEFYSEM